MFKNKPWTFWVLIALIVVAVGVGVYLLVKGNSTAAVDRTALQTGYTIGDGTVDPNDIDLLTNPNFANSEWLYVTEGSICMIPPDSKIMYAYYGSPPTWVDVKAMISAKVRGKPGLATMFVVSNAAFNGLDPVKGSVKQLRVKYLFNET